ncbi:MAG: BolA family protein [Holosporales bacterium]
MNRLEAIRNLLMVERTPSDLVIEDESHLHKGHRGAPQGQAHTHLHISMTSQAFCGLSRIQQHQLIMNMLKPHFEDGLHALRLTLRAPALNKES